MDSTAWDARYAMDQLVWGAEPNRFVAAEFTGLRPGRALDLGAGEGRNAIWLARQGWQVTAVDFSPVAVERARRLAMAENVDVTWIVADVADYRPEPGAFDAVLVAYLHLPAKLRAVALARAATALAPGGRIVVVGHDVASAGAGVGGPQGPAILYTPQRIVAELPGLTVHTAEQVRRPIQTDHGTTDAIDTLVVAARPAGDDGGTMGLLANVSSIPLSQHRRK